MNIFGTDGIRGTCGHAWLTPRGTYAIGHALGHWLTEHTTAATIAVASDTRASRHALHAWLYSALSLYPHHIVDYGILPTPALVAIMREKNISCGIMLTASHNQHPDNGIKIYRSSGAKLLESDEAKISTYAYDAWQQPYTYEHTSALHQNTAYSSIYTETTGITKYTEFLYSRCTPDLRNTKIVIDAAAGATHTIASHIFHTLGAHVIITSPEPDGYNINVDCGSTAPQCIQKAVCAHNADIGFAFDGDGDRLIAVNRNGAIKDGDDILAILTHHPAYRSTSHVVTTVMSNMGLHEHFQHRNIPIIETAVGDKHVAAQLQQHPHASIGGEPSGHIILTDLHITGDGILTALRLLEAIIATSNWELESFEKYAQITYTIPIQTRKPLDQSPLRDIITTYKKRIDGRLYARYSGTEPVMRLLIESKDYNHAHMIGQQAQSELVHILGEACDE